MPKRDHQGCGRHWFQEASHEEYLCPACQGHSTVSDLVYSPYMRISYYGFVPAQCPHCEAFLTYDFERKALTRRGDGRKPPCIMLGSTRYLDILLAVVGIGVLVTGKLFWIPIVFCGLLFVEFTWELVLKGNNPEWFIWDTEFDWVTTRMVYVGLPLLLVRWCLVLAAVYHTCM